MNIELSDKDVELILGMLKFIDKTGFFVEKLGISIFEQYKKQKEEPVIIRSTTKL